MKKIYGVWILFICMGGQTQTVLPSLALAVSLQKTTNLIFPYRIEKADIGSGDVIGHRDERLQNVLFLKATRKGFVPTNLSVYTSDGKFYSFIVRYMEEPDTLNLSFINTRHSPSASVDSFMDAKLDSDAVSIADQPAFLHRSDGSQKMKVTLHGIYLKDQLLWFRVRLTNHSEIDYLTESVRFFVCDKKTGKRTAMQESEISPVWRSRSIAVPGQGENLSVFGFLPFTIGKKKKLIIRITEKNGDRILHLDIPAKTLLKSKSL